MYAVLLWRARAGVGTSVLAATLGGSSRAHRLNTLAVRFAQTEIKFEFELHFCGWQAHGGSTARAEAVLIQAAVRQLTC